MPVTELKQVKIKDKLFARRMDWIVGTWNFKESLSLSKKFMIKKMMRGILRKQLIIFDPMSGGPTNYKKIIKSFA